MSFFSEGFMGLALLGKNAKDSGKGKGPTQTGCMVIIALMLAFTLSVAWMVQRYYPAKNNARIEGRVVTLNGEPLKDAVIESEGERVSTNINGHFTIVLPNRGQQVDLKVTHNAYRNVKHHFVNLADGSPPAIQITMGTADSYSGPSPSPVSTSPPPSNTPPSGVSGGGSSNTPPPVYEKNYHLEVDERYDAFVKKREDLAGVGEYLLDLEVLSTSGEPLFSGVWSRTVSPDKMWLDDPGAFDRKNGEFQRDGFNLV
ncbi:MAG: carboxypeptidase regulatory-like domain-containing protein, partial [Calditrichaeota bacterium]|nr:carboxypeptidase regulatory-like domain-containing protein [Calditrichota bacterium]